MSSVPLHRAPRWIAVLGAALLVAAGLPASAAGPPGQPFLFANLSQGTEPVGSAPHVFPGPVGGAYLMIAGDPVFGRELWRTDGTEQGTFLLKDLCLGSCSFVNHQRLTTVRDDLAFFVSVERGAADGEPFLRLWRTDGTGPGTLPLLRSEGFDEMDELLWLPTAQRLVFTAAVAPGGAEVWTSDGTVAGTRMLRDLRPGAESSKPSFLTLWHDAVYFTANDGIHGLELWTSDGTEAGTRLVVDLLPGAESSGASVEADLGDRLLLSAYDPSQGRPLWVTDGTAAGTRYVGNPQPHGLGSYLREVSNGRRAFFFAYSPYNPSPELELWTSDGTAAGTRRLVSLPGPSTRQVFYRDLVPLGDDLLLFNWQTAEQGLEPWVSDGTVAGTRPLGDLCPGECSSRFDLSFSLDFRVAGGLAYFSADDGIHGFEPWVTDGTPEGTRMLLDACPGECQGFGHDSNLGALGDRMLLAVGSFAARSLVLTAGTQATTSTLIEDGVYYASSPRPLPGGDGYLFVVEHRQLGHEPWVTDLTAAGTHLLRDIHPERDLGSNPRYLQPVGDHLAFWIEPEEFGEDPELWLTDGSRAATNPVSGTPDYLLEARSRGGGVLVAATDDRLFQIMNGSLDPGVPPLGAALDPVTGNWTDLPPLEDLGTGERPYSSPSRIFLVGYDVWSSDGTVAGSSLVPGIGARPRSYAPAAVVGDDLYFEALHPTLPGLYLWRSDGTAAGTVAVSPLGDRGLDTLTAFGDGVMFVHDGKLEVSDGNPGPAQTVMTFPADAGEGEAMAAVGGRVFFFLGIRLWTTDGTAGGTRSFDTPPVRWIAAAPDRLLFAVLASPGQILWSSDGTESGTGPLGGADDPLIVGEGSFSLTSRVLGDRVLVAASTGGQYDPWELWVTDGRRASTYRVGLFADQPQGAVRLGDTVYFAAEHPRYGEELWAFHLDGSPPPPALRPPCQADDHTLCLLGGRFQVRATWHDPRSGDSGQAGARPFPGSERTGLFWFFNPANVELIVKQLDGRSLNGFFWTFYGALSDVEYWLEVTDLDSGASRTFYNRPGEICGRGETGAFPGQVLSASQVAAAAGGSCDDPAVLCLQDDRFEVRVDWHDPRSGDSGSGTAIPGTERSGYFWFFRDDNVELVVKVLDGRPVNGRFWVFYGALTDVEYDVRVTDTASGETQTYHNPPGEICGGADTGTF